MNLPVENLILNSNIHLHNKPFMFCDEIKKIKIGENVKRVEIYYNLGIRKLKELIIPFNINRFENNNVYSDSLDSITIYHEDQEYIIELDDVFKNRKIDITMSNNGNVLDIVIESDCSKINYQVFIKEGKLELRKKYIKYEILPDESKELDLIKLKEKYSCKLIPNEILKKEKLIFSKNEYDIIKNCFIDKNTLKKIIIKDDNEMSLFPRIIEINTNNGLFQNIELYNNKILAKIETEDKSDRYILINEDLSYIDFELNFPFNHPFYIKRIYLDMVSDKFKLSKENEEYILTIPFNKYFKLEDSFLIISLIQQAREIYIKSEDKEIKINKLFSGGRFLISNIERYGEKDFIVYYKSKHYKEMYQHIIYIYDDLLKEYNSRLGKCASTEHRKEYDNIKKLVLKRNIK